MYTSQEMPNLRRFLARFLPGDNQMTIILEIILYINLSDKDVIDLLIFFKAESSSLISGSGVNMLPIKSISME